ncbi:hypothetical protein TNCV_2477831 [Trichonephila clavipes]|nr:hypothetical protein TNCV_2477831 [Trichonephila clavipes]
MSFNQALRMVQEDTGPPSEGISAPVKQLAVRVHFLRCGGLLNYWSVEDVLSLVFLYMTSLGSTGPSTSSQHYQSGLIDKLLA